MPGMKHMKQDRRPVDGQDTLQTMQDKKSGIYQDRVDGKLPQSRVAQHYQDMDAKMMQATEEKKSTTTKPPAPPKPGTAGYNAYMAKKNAEKKKESESGVVGTIKKYAKMADKYLTGTTYPGTGF